MQITRTLAVQVVVLVLAAAGHAAAAGADLRLIQAVRRGDVPAVHQLIRQKVDVNARQPDGATALHWAADAEDAKMTSLLLAAGAEVAVANDYGVTPLLIAVTGRTSEVVEVLLAAGARANEALPTGETALMSAARSGSLGAVKALLAKGADPNAQETVKGQSALMWAIVEGHVEVARTLIAGGADVRATSINGFTPLLFAIREGRRDLAHELLARGASVNETAADGVSALHVAVIRGHLDLAKDLLARGADPNAAKCGYTALHWAAGTWETIHSHDYIFNQTAVNKVQEWAVLAGITNLTAKYDLIRMLLAHGANVNAQTTKAPPEYGFALFKTSLIVGGTPFYIASLVSDIPTMRLLLEHGADPALTARDGDTPLIVAAGLGRVPNETRVTEERVIEGVNLLLSLNSPINASNKAGVTALHAATMAGLDTVVRHLVSKGADINAKTKKGETPLKLANGFEDTALFFERPSTAKLLKELGASE